MVIPLAKARAAAGCKDWWQILGLPFQAGLQEVRKKWRGVTTESGYTIAQSASDDGGHGGCLIAVSNKLDFNEPVAGCPLSLTVCEKDVNILLAAPRYIYVRIAAPRFQALVCSATPTKKGV